MTSEHKWLHWITFYCVRVNGLQHYWLLFKNYFETKYNFPPSATLSWFAIYCKLRRQDLLRWSLVTLATVFYKKNMLPMLQSSNALQELQVVMISRVGMSRQDNSKIITCQKDLWCIESSWCSAVVQCMSWNSMSQPLNSYSLVFFARDTNTHIFMCMKKSK